MNKEFLEKRKIGLNTYLQVSRQACTDVLLPVLAVALFRCRADKNLLGTLCNVLQFAV